MFLGLTKVKDTNHGQRARATGQRKANPSDLWFLSISTYLLGHPGDSPLSLVPFTVCSLYSRAQRLTSDTGFESSCNLAMWRGQAGLMDTRLQCDLCSNTCNERKADPFCLGWLLGGPGNVDESQVEHGWEEASVPGKGNGRQRWLLSLSLCVTHREWQSGWQWVRDCWAGGQGRQS